MKILWRGIQAATIETLGVVILLLVLFGLPTWALSGSPRVTPGIPNLPEMKQADQVPDSPQNYPETALEETPIGSAAIHHPDRTARDQDRDQYTKQRLSSCSRSFCNTLSHQVDHMIDQVFPD